MVEILPHWRSYIKLKTLFSDMILKNKQRDIKEMEKISK